MEIDRREVAERIGRDDLQPLLVEQSVFQGVEWIRWGAEVELLGKTWMGVETGSMLKCMCMCMCLALRRESYK